MHIFRHMILYIINICDRRLKLHNRIHGFFSVVQINFASNLA